MAGLIDYWNQGTDLVQRNMKQVGPAMKEVFGERIYPNRLSGPAATTAGKTVAKGSPLAALVAGYEGVTELAEAFDPRKIGPGIDDLRAKLATPEQKAEGKAYGESVANQAVGDAMRDVQSAPAPVTVPPQNLPTQPAEVQAKVQKAKEEEARQFVESKVYDAVDKERISRPEIAKAVVKADQQRTGEKLTEEEEKAKVKEETSFLRSMDKEEVSKYLSYALIAGGIYAGFADESGRSGDIFVGAYERERTRQDEKRYRKEQAEIAQAAAELKQANKEREFGQKDTEIGIKAGSADGQQQYQEGILTLRAMAERREASGQGARLSLDERRLTHDITQDAVRNGLLAQKNAILAAEAAGASGPEGITLSTKDATTQIDEWAETQGVDIDPATAQAVGIQLQYVLKNNPTQFAQDPSGTINGLLKANRSTKESAVPFRDPYKAYTAPGLLQ